MCVGTAVGRCERRTRESACRNRISVYLCCLFRATGVAEKPARSNSKGRSSDIGSVSSISHGIGFIMENVVVRKLSLY